MDQSWWMSMTSIEHVYWIIAIAASTMLAIQLVIASVTGLDLHSGSDLGGHHGDVGLPHFQLLTLRNIVAFFTIMGWSGIAFYHQHLPTALVVLLSIFCGLLMMLTTAAIFYGLSKLQSSGTLDSSGAVGKQASVYLTIPPAGGGNGQIHLVLQGKIVEMGAVTRDAVEIPTGSTVTVKELDNSNAVVERVRV
jgi:hypothetical protein